MGTIKNKPVRYRMDNSATIYPMVVTKTSQSLFGLGAELSEPIDKNLFLQAINRSFERFPYFKVRIRYGAFRPYFEENDKPYKLLKDRRFILETISFPHNNGYPFGTEIKGNKVYMIFFHALCDANGGMEFLKTAVYTYLLLKNEILPPNGVKTPGEAIDKEEYEDAFERYYEKFPLVSGAKNMAGGYAYGVAGPHLPENRFDENVVSCETVALLKAAREHGCTVTVFLASLLALAVFQSHDAHPRKYNYVFFIPVNYRKFFPSITMRNFTGFARCNIAKETDFTLENLIGIIGEEMKKQLDKTELKRKLSFSSLMSKNLLMRILPYPVKKRISLWGRGLGKMPRQTMILSNIGKVDFPETDYVKRFMFFVNCNARTPENVGVLSYKDETQIAFVRKIVSDKTEKKFAELLSQFVPCTIVHEYNI